MVLLAQSDFLPNRSIFLFGIDDIILPIDEVSVVSSSSPWVAGGDLPISGHSFAACDIDPSKNDLSVDLIK